ncbi:SPASM domain-containing protein [Methanoregula formicica]|uniref:SPASM domain-containing protein n=1 Tax=Methanoregula formicica TaxID=882104 RepID=UPI0009FDA44E
MHRLDFFFCGAVIIAGDLRKETFEKIWEQGSFPCRNEGLPHISRECRECTVLDLCRGGCQVMWLGEIHCTKERVSHPAW